MALPALVMMNRASTAAWTGTLALPGTLALAAAGWVVSVWQMNGMNMGPATELGSIGFFAAVWVAMMAGMMLPGTAPALVRHVRASRSVLAGPLFVGGYLAVWALVGVAVYAVYRPHESLAAGVGVIVAGLYELTPLKRHFRRRCRQSAGSGTEFGLCCVGSSTGLMLALLALGVMSITWMAAIALVIVAQKLLPATVALDVPLAAAIVGLGIWTIS